MYKYGSLPPGSIPETVVISGGSAVFTTHYGPHRATMLWDSAQSSFVGVPPVLGQAVFGLFKPEGVSPQTSVFPSVRVNSDIS